MDAHDAEQGGWKTLSPITTVAQRVTLRGITVPGITCEVIGLVLWRETELVLVRTLHQLAMLGNISLRELSFQQRMDLAPIRRVCVVDRRSDAIGTQTAWRSIRGWTAERTWRLSKILGRACSQA